MREKARSSSFMKKLLAIFAALAMVLTMGVGSAIPAMAANNLSITVNNAQPGQTYTLYKLFDATVTNTRASQTDAGETSEVMTNGIRYTVPSGKSLDTTNWTTSEGSVTTNAGTTWFKVDDAGNVTQASDNIDLTTTEFRNWAINFGTQVGQAQTVDSSATAPQQIKFENLTDGYYFVTSSMGSLVTVTSIAPNAIVRDKNTVPDVDKEEDVKTSSVGDEVTYTVHISIPSATENLVFHDRLTDGLTLEGTEPTSITAGGTALTKTTDYTVDYWNATKSTTEGKTNGDNITISFTSDYLSNLSTQTTVTLTYKAKINASAQVNMENEAYIKYGHDGNTESTHKKVYESSFGFILNKVDGSNNPLTGAKFALSTSSDLGNIDESYVTNANNSSKFYAFSSDGTYDPDAGTGSTKILEANKGTSQNSLTLKGLNDNNTDTITYYLYEVTAPDGYNKLTAPIEIQFVPTFDTTDATHHQSKVTGYTLKYKTPGATNYTDVGTGSIEISAHTFNVQNTEGTLLPSTGGIGTTIFYVIGGVLVAGAVILLVSRRRRNA